ERVDVDQHLAVAQRHRRVELFRALGEHSRLAHHPAEAITVDHHQRLSRSGQGMTSTMATVTAVVASALRYTRRAWEAMRAFSSSLSTRRASLRSPSTMIPLRANATQVCPVAWKKPIAPMKVGSATNSRAHHGECVSSSPPIASRVS